MSFSALFVLFCYAVLSYRCKAHAPSPFERRATLASDMRLASRLGAVFFALTITATVPLLVLGHEGYHERFIAGASLISPTSTDFTFYSLLPIGSLIEHNISVAATYFLLGLLFRQLGAIIVIAYNALAWGIAFGGQQSPSQQPTPFGSSLVLWHFCHTWQ